MAVRVEAVAVGGVRRVIVLLEGVVLMAQVSDGQGKVVISSLGM